jgi:hypothetical protein
MMRSLLLAALLVGTLGIVGCAEDSEASRTDGVGQGAAAQTSTQTATAPTNSPEPPPAGQGGSDEEQIRAVLKQEHDAFLAGDTDAYCQTLADELRNAMAGCEFIRDGLAFQQSRGLVIENQEILELTMEGEKAYAAVYMQQDDKSPGAQTPADFELTKTDGVWRISMARYRTEREEGPAKCFVGGSTSDLC